MRPEIRRFFLRSAAVTALSLFAGSAGAQLSGKADVNVSKRVGNESECTISQNPVDPKKLFVACNKSGPGLFSARSEDGGVNWLYPNGTMTIADRERGPVPEACCDPSSTWDTFGNLFLAYIGKSRSDIVIIRSKDDGKTFSELRSFHGSVDQPTIVAAKTSDPKAPVALWVVWNQGLEGVGYMVAVGAPVTGPDAVGDFGGLQKIQGTEDCSFGDVAIAPSGIVVQVCQNPTAEEGPARILASADLDGLGSANFGTAYEATKTNVGGLDFIPAQNTMSVDAEAGVAFGKTGRLYLVYSEETAPEQHDLDVMMRTSDDNGANWSLPIRVNDDPPGPSQFLPRIAIDASSGRISVCWYDCRDDPSNNRSMRVYCTTASPIDEEPRFLRNAAISDGSATRQGHGYQAGDYMGLVYLNDVAHPIWVDTSRAAGRANPTYEVLTDRVAEETQEPQRRPQRSATPSRTPRPTRTPRRTPSHPGG